MVRDAKVKIPPKVVEWFRDQNLGIDKLAEFLEYPNRVLNVLVVNPDDVPLETRTFLRHGAPKIVVDTATASGTETKTLDLRPAAGYRWLVLRAWGYHNSGSAKNEHWQYTDGTNTIAENVVSSAATPRLHITMSDAVSGINVVGGYGFMILTRDVYAQFVVASLDTTKIAYLNALVLELAEV